MQEKDAMQVLDMRSCLSCQVEKERQEEEILSQKRAEELKKLQEEEAAQKLEAERMEQEYLAAQAV